MGALVAMWREPDGAIFAIVPPAIEWQQLAIELAERRGCSMEWAWARLIAAERILNGPHGKAYASRPTYRTALALAEDIDGDRVNELVPTARPVQET